MGLQKSGTTDKFTFYYQNKDHLGTVRETVTSTGAMKQRVNYYPFGGQLVDTLKAMVLNRDFQQYKYNGKEFDGMYGLNTYDYGARHYDAALCLFPAMDPLCEKYYNVSPYAYCANNPIILVDPDGKNPIYDTRGNFLGCTSEGYTGQIYVYKGNEAIDWQKQTMEDILEKDDLGDFMTFEDVESSYSGDAKVNFVSKVMTDIVGHAENKHIFNFSFSTSTLHNGGIGFSLNPKSHFTTEKRKGEVKVRIEAHEDIGVDYEATVENLSSSLIVHEWYSHGIKGYGDKKKNHRLAYLKVMEDKTFYPKTTKKYKEFVKSKYNKYKNKEVK